MKAKFVALRPVSSIIAMLICVLAVGCGETEQHEETLRLRLLSSYFSQYRGHHKGRVPESEEDLKQFITANGAEGLSRAGISSVDELFVSTRDGKPFVVKYRGDRAWPLPDAVAYESEGRGGIRYTATVVGGLDRVSDEDFRSRKAASSAAKL